MQNTFRLYELDTENKSISTKVSLDFRDSVRSTYFFVKRRHDCSCVSLCMTLTDSATEIFGSFCKNFRGGVRGTANEVPFRLVLTKNYPRTTTVSIGISFGHPIDFAYQI